MSQQTKKYRQEVILLSPEINRLQVLNEKTGAEYRGQEVLEFLTVFGSLFVFIGQATMKNDDAVCCN
jgi:hypothetical protein